MWVGEHGGVLGSVTIGGCVDAHVLHAAEEVFRSGAARLLGVDLGEADAHALGLTCAGAVDVLIQPVEPRSEPWVEVAAGLRKHVAAGGRAVLATVLPPAVKAAGPSGEQDGARGPDLGAVTPGRPLMIDEHGRTAGSTGVATLDARIAERAVERLKLGGGGVETVPIAGGEVAVWLEAHGRGPLLAIVGGGPIAAALARIGRSLGQHVVVIDGRARFADPAQFPDAHEVLTGAPAGVLREKALDPSASVVLVAHDYKFDLPVLREVLVGAAGYIGMLGSRKRVRTMLEMLDEEGFTAEQRARVHAPIGLDIGGRTAAEIALSIAAEIVAVRHGRSGGSMRSRPGQA